MTRGRSTSAPSYRLHKATGQARVTIYGKTYYLGQHGTELSEQRYRQHLADYWKPGPAPKVDPSPITGVVTITHLAIDFATYAKNKYGDKPEWKNQIKPVLKYIRETYGHLPASEFGPLRLESYRQHLADKGLSRLVVKRKSNYIIKMFQRAVKIERIPVQLWQRLLAIGPVEMKTKPKRKRRAVPLEIVVATQDELTPVLSDMVEVHRLIGARPTEVCTMRPCDIDRSQAVWIYTPASHKTKHHGHDRRITIGPQAQAVLSRYLLRDEQAFCFTPSEAYEQHQERRSENRKTPLNQGNRPRPRKPRTFKPRYDKDSYRRAIVRAAARAFPAPEDVQKDQNKLEQWLAKYSWRPNQLRKSAATMARKEMDLETAQLVLGHASKKTTEQFYAEMDSERAIEFAQKFG